jgi:hypothetical protein
MRFCIFCASPRLRDVEKSSGVPACRSELAPSLEVSLDRCRMSGRASESSSPGSSSPLMVGDSGRTSSSASFWRSDDPSDEARSLSLSWLTMLWIKDTRTDMMIDASRVSLKIYVQVFG